MTLSPSHSFMPPRIMGNPSSLMRGRKERTLQRGSVAVRTSSARPGAEAHTVNGEGRRDGEGEPNVAGGRAPLRTEKALATIRPPPPPSRTSQGKSM